jgi:hypothetical protein
MDHLTTEVVHKLPFTALLQETADSICKDCNKLTCHHKRAKMTCETQCCNNEIIFKNFSDIITEFPNLTDYTNMYVILGTLESTGRKTLTVYDTLKRETIEKYAYDVDEKVTYHVLDNKLLFLSTTPRYFKIFTLLPKNKTYIHYHYSGAPQSSTIPKFFVTDLHFMLFFSDIRKLEIYEHDFTLKNTVSALNIKCLCCDDVMILNNPNSGYDYYDLTNHVIIDKNMPFVEWYKDMVIEQDGKNNVLMKRFIKNKLTRIDVPKNQCYICKKDLKNKCVLVPCGHSQFHTECVKKMEGKKCQMCGKEWNNCVDLIV